MTNTKPTHGGPRKGSGRKPKPAKQKAVSVCLSISQDANKRLRREAKRKGVGIGKIANGLFLKLNPKDQERNASPASDCSTTNPDKP